MPRSVLTRTLRDGSRSIAGFGAYIVLMVAAIVSIYPSIGHNPSLDKLVKSYPGTLKAFLGFGGVVDYSSAVGYLGIELFSLVLPGLMIAAAVTAGARAIAGEEEQQTLDLLLANPISRPRLVLEKAGAVAALEALLAVVAFASLAISVTAAGLDISVGHLAAAAAATGLLGLLYGSIALAVGAASGRRGLCARRCRRRSRGGLHRERDRLARRGAAPATAGIALLPVRRRRPAPPRAHVRARHSPGRRRSGARCSRGRRLRQTRPRVDPPGGGALERPSPRRCPRYLTTVMASRIAGSW